MRVLRNKTRGAQSFPVHESRSVTVLSAGQFAVAGCDPWTYIVGNTIGLEQKGIINPAIVQDCQYDSTNARMLISVSINLDAIKPLRVWLAAGMNRYYMLSGGDKGIWAFVPGGMAAAAAPKDTTEVMHAGRFGSPAHSILSTGTPTYSTDISLLGGNPLKLGSDKAIAFGTGFAQWPNKRGMLLRTHLQVASLADEISLLYAYYTGQNYNMINILPDGSINCYSQSNGMSQVFVNVTTPTGYITTNTPIDLCIEQDFAASKFRFWINGVYKTTLTAANNIQNPSTPWAVGQRSGLTFDPSSGVFTHTVPATPVSFYISDYLVLNYAPILTDSIAIPQVTKPFNYPGLREAV